MSNIHLLNLKREKTSIERTPVHVFNLKRGELRHLAHPDLQFLPGERLGGDGERISRPQS